MLINYNKTRLAAWRSGNDVTVVNRQVRCISTVAQCAQSQLTQTQANGRQRVSATTRFNNITQFWFYGSQNRTVLRR